MQLRLQPPRIEDELVDFLSRWRKSGKRWPNEMPAKNVDAAKWWIRMQGKPKNEKPELMQKRRIIESDPVEYFWKDPYLNRLLYTLKVFMNLPTQHQEIVIKAKEDGIYWRGDDISFFLIIIKNTGRPNIDIENFE